ncbi:uncharacterized protein LOC114319134 [Camellia sinensis]|uniref:uncharacterized protein LOC114319134 n=1 Tax=Camellia sinensis TaxID=4442 RepID=UPI0010367D3A|nr:uncharacterized protein LOC114319134 [Camellia sinensis]
MDFVVRLTRTPRGMNSIWVIVDRLTKSAHFLPVKTQYHADKLAVIYVNEIVKLHGVQNMVRTRAEEPEYAIAALLDRMERMIMEMAETLRGITGSNSGSSQYVEATNLVAQNRISEWKGKRQNNQWSMGSSIPPDKEQNLVASNTFALRQDTIPVCSECGKKHRGTCQWKSGACYQCGKMGRLIKDCPQRNQRTGNRAATSSAGSAPTANTKSAAKPTNNKDTARLGRVFVLVPGDVQNAATVVSGIFMVHGHSACVLFDYGSTHSFESKLFAQNLDKAEEKLSYMLCVSSPLGDSMLCISVYFGCELELGDIRFPPCGTIRVYLSGTWSDFSTLFDFRSKGL